MSDSAILAVGDQCSAEYCHLIDFLPFKCQHCSFKFCADHYKVDNHKCDKYDETKHNRIAPSCPLCNTPIAIPPGQDPNIRMEQHIASECSVMTGKAKSSKQPHCANARCNKVLYAPITCKTCKQQFCAQHRFPADHKCSTSQLDPPKQTPAFTAANIASETSARSAAAMAALKRSMANKPAAQQPSSQPARPQPVASSSAKAPSSTPGHNMFSKTDRRAKSERESRLKAMEERAKKGLLSEDEKAILAAERAKGNGKDDCVVM